MGVRFALVATMVISLAATAVSNASRSSQPSMCANLWNHTAPSKLRARIISQHPRAAFINPHVSVTSVTWTKTSLLKLERPWLQHPVRPPQLAHPRCMGFPWGVEASL